MNEVFSFLHLAFIAFVTLFPPVNPVGTAFIVDPLLSGLTRKERKFAARKVAFYGLCISIVSILTGSWILKLFGLSLPVVQIAGGIIICNMGWQLLSAKSDNQRNPERKTRPEDQLKETENILFYPITFPMTTGAGTISVLLTLSASSALSDTKEYLLNTGSLIVGVLLMSFVIYICIANTHLILKRMGERGQQVVNRISAFLVLCVGLQIVWEGVKHLIKI